jgi:hypothetical protein
MRRVATLPPAGKAGVLLIFDVHLVVGGAHTPEACRRTHNRRRRRSGSRRSGSRRSGSGLRRVAMMSSLIRRRQSGRSCESEDSKTNKNAFGQSRLLEAAAKGRGPGCVIRGKPDRAFSPVAPSSLQLGAEMWVCSGGNAALALIGAHCCATATRCQSIRRSCESKRAAPEGGVSAGAGGWRQAGITHGRGCCARLSRAPGQMAATGRSSASNAESAAGRITREKPTSLPTASENTPPAPNRTVSFNASRSLDSGPNSQ